MDDLVLGRIVHYCVPRLNGAFSCQTAIVTHVSGSAANLVAWDQDGDQFVRLDVPRGVPGPEKATFHLTRFCPLGR